MSASPNDSVELVQHIEPLLEAGRLEFGPYTVSVSAIEALPLEAVIAKFTMRKVHGIRMLRKRPLDAVTGYKLSIFDKRTGRTESLLIQDGREIGPLRMKDGKLDC